MENKTQTDRIPKTLKTLIYVNEKAIRELIVERDALTAKIEALAAECQRIEEDYK